MEKSANPRTLVVCSGGLDSITLAYRVARTGHLSRLLSFDYGQRHKKELDCAARCADDLGVRHSVLDISTVGAFLSGSALTDDIAVPDGHYAENTMKATVVPNRNAIMLTIAFGVAAAEGLNTVATAVHGGDHFIYPDCRPGFIRAFAAMQDQALDDKITLLTPYLDLPKSAIVAEGLKLAVPYAQTWSCYKGGARHCGRCGTCVERREAFAQAGAQDPAPCDDPDFWSEAVRAR